MPEKVLSSLMKMTAAMQRIPKQEAERLAYEAAIRAGYDMNEVIKALEKSGVPSARARAAAKQAQIIEDMLRGM